jgi:hypothetical protein
MNDKERYAMGCAVSVMAALGCPTVMKNNANNFIDSSNPDFNTLWMEASTWCIATISKYKEVNRDFGQTLEKIAAMRHDGVELTEATMAHDILKTHKKGGA